MKRALLPLFTTLICSSAVAGEINSFELAFNRHEIPLSDNSRLDIDGIDAHYSEQGSLSQLLPLQLELTLGREVVSHVDEPQALGFQPDGYHLGITLGTRSPRWHMLELGASLGYSYHSTSQQFNQQQIDIDWHQTEARGWLALSIGNAGKLYGCAITSHIDGTQTLNGTTPSRLAFENSAHTGYCAGVELEVGDGGYIGVEAESRHQNGGRLYFGKRYGFY